MNQQTLYDERLRLRKKIRLTMLIFLVGLVVSGATAIPLETELDLLTSFIKNSPAAQLADSSFGQWVFRVHNGFVETNARYPFIAYGTDWLAFAHLVIAIAFIGPFLDPVKNIWVVEFGMIACVLVVPFALAMGTVREIPLGWRLIDSSFGVFGILPLWLCRRLIKRLTGLQLPAQVPHREQTRDERAV